jgi:hypothetical protein
VLLLGDDFTAFQSHLKTLGFEIIQPRSTKNEIIFFHRLFQKNRKDLIQLIPDAPAAAALLSSLPVAPTFNNGNPIMNGMMPGNAGDSNGTVAQQQAAFQQLQQLQLSLMQAQLSSYVNQMQNANNGGGSGNGSSTSDSSSSSHGFGGFPLPADPVTGFNGWPGFSPGFFNQFNPWLLSMQAPFMNFLQQQQQQQQQSSESGSAFPPDSLLLSSANQNSLPSTNFSLPSLASLTMGSTINGSTFLPSYLLSSYQSNPLLQNVNMSSSHYNNTHQAFLSRKLQQVSSIFKDRNIFPENEENDDNSPEKSRRKANGRRDNRKPTTMQQESEDEREVSTNKRKRGRLSKSDLRNIPSTVLSHSLIKSSLLMQHQQQQRQESDDESLQSIDDEEVNRRQSRSRSKRGRKPGNRGDSSRGGGVGGRSDDDSGGLIIRKRSSETSNRSIMNRERNSDYPITRSSYSSLTGGASSSSASLSSKAIAEDMLDCRKVNNKRLFIDFTISHHPPISKQQSDEITQQQNENIALLEKENNYVYGYFHGKLINNEECTSYRFASQGHSEYLPLPVPIPTTSTRSRVTRASTSSSSSRVGPSYQADIPQCLSKKSLQKTSNLLEEREWVPSMIDEEDLSSLVHSLLHKKKEWLPTIGNIYTVKILLSDEMSYSIMKYKLCAVIEVNPVLLKKPNKKIRERCYLIRVYDGEEEYLIPVENIVRALHMEDEEFLDIVHKNDYSTDNVGFCCYRIL